MNIYIKSASDEVGLWNRIPEHTQYIIHDTKLHQNLKVWKFDFAKIWYNMIISLY